MDLLLEALLNPVETSPDRSIRSSWAYNEDLIGEISTLYCKECGGIGYFEPSDPQDADIPCPRCGGLGH